MVGRGAVTFFDSSTCGDFYGRAVVVTQTPPQPVLTVAALAVVVVGVSLFAFWRTRLPLDCLDARPKGCSSERGGRTRGGAAGWLFGERC